MHIYAFGSLCRGEVDTCSDVDLLALVDGHDSRFDPQQFSIYGYSRIRTLWRQGNPFAWHLYLESRLIFADEGGDFLRELGPPKEYNQALTDCRRFVEIFDVAMVSLHETSATQVFDLSIVFLAIRNIATCYSLQVGVRPTFSRHSARELAGMSLDITENVYAILERARVLSTRGVGDGLSPDEVDLANTASHQIRDWMNRLLRSLEERHERV